MISLILLVGCREEAPTPLFEGNELNEYQKIVADYSPPTYKWGYLTKEGTLAIEDKYDDLREFNNGLAAMNISGLWGYVDVFGNEPIPARFRTVGTFTEGIAVVQDLNGHFHLLEKNGQPITDSLHYNEVKNFSEGMAVYSDGLNFGFLNQKGKIAIEAEYSYATAFTNGMSIVQKNGKFGIINQKNDKVIPIEYDKLWSPSNGLLRYKKEGNFGYIDLNSKQRVLKSYTSATDFQGSKAIVHDGNNYFLVDKNGSSEQLPYSFIDVGGEGKWMYSANNKFGFLNNDGSVLTLPQYDLLMRYREGRAGYSINDIWGYLDDNGKIVIPAQFPLVWDFVNGYARMISQYGFGFIDLNGRQILEPRYMEVRDFSEGLARIQVYR
ncbi:MAG: WG repeat-containing protein [Saprospiraceae bacterium]|nr:WG repeat-containing protein [Saprospiraceae bacterium]